MYSEWLEITIRWFWILSTVNNLTLIWVLQIQIKLAFLYTAVFHTCIALIHIFDHDSLAVHGTMLWNVVCIFMGWTFIPANNSLHCTLLACIQLLGKMDLVMRGLLTDRVIRMTQSLQPGIHRVSKHLTLPTCFCCKVGLNFEIVGLKDTRIVLKMNLRRGEHLSWLKGRLHITVRVAVVVVQAYFLTQLQSL